MSAAPAGAQRPEALIAGVGESGPTPRDDRAIPEIVLEAVEAALADAGVTFDEIDATVTASVDLTDGLTASNIAITEVVGAVMRPETRIAGDGIAALAHAACLIWSGTYRTVLVVAHGKASMADQDALSRWALDPVTLQRHGVSSSIIQGLQACAIAGSTEGAGADERWTRRAAKLRATTVAEVLDSPIVATPLRKLMLAPSADGAAALILRTGGSDTDGDEGDTDDAVRLSGVGLDLDAHEPGDRDLTRWTGLTRALDRALGQANAEHGGPGAGAAGATNATNATDATSATITTVAASVRAPHEEELFAAATGLVPTITLFGGDVPTAAGLGQVIAATRGLRGRTGRAVAHGSWGPAGQAHAVAVLDARQHLPGVDRSTGPAGQAHAVAILNAHQHLPGADRSSGPAGQAHAVAVLDADQHLPGVDRSGEPTAHAVAVLDGPADSGATP